MKNCFWILSLYVGAACAGRPAEGAANTNAAARQTNAVRVTSELITALSEEMRTNHPAIHAFRWRADASAANARAVRAWEDPMAKIGGMTARTGMRAEDGDLIYGLEQKLPLFGKPQAERRVAEAETAANEQRVELQFQTLRRDLAKALFRAALNDRAVELRHQDIAWLDTLVNSVEAKYRNGTATLVELIQAQNERARRINQLRSDESRVEHELVALDRFVSRRYAEPWPRLELPGPASPIQFTAKLLSFAYRAEPKLRVMRQEFQLARDAVEAAWRKTLPDVSVGAQGRTYSRNGDFRSAEVMLSFNVPLGNRGRYRAEIKREQARAVAVEYDIDNEEKALAEEVHQLVIMIENARREAVLYRDEILPRTRTALDTAHSAWLSGAGMLRDVIESRRMLTEAELMYARAVAEQYQAMSELVLCCGLGDFEALQMIGVREEQKP